MEGMEGMEGGEKTSEVIIVSEEVFTIGRRFSIIDDVLILAVVIHHPDTTQTPRYVIARTSCSCGIRVNMMVVGTYTIIPL